MIEPIEARLARLAEPASPPALAATVMARIARASAPGPATAGQAVRPPATVRGGSLGGLWAFIGTVLVIGVVVHGWIATGSAPDLLSSRIGNGGLVLMPVQGWTSLLLCAGLVLYLRGLFAPLRRRV
jgi:hypothetical protein